MLPLLLDYRSTAVDDSEVTLLLFAGDNTVDGGSHGGAAVAVACLEQVATPEGRNWFNLALPWGERETTPPFSPANMLLMEDVRLSP